MILLLFSLEVLLTKKRDLFSACNVIPAGTGEKMQYLAHQFNDVTVRFVLHYPGAVDVDCLRQAAKAVIDSVDILHASLCVEGGDIFWRVHRDYEESCYFQYVKTEDDPMAMAVSAALEPVRPEEKTKLRCVLVQGEEGSAVAVSISHLCADGGDAKYLLHKLTEAYDRILTTGSCRGLYVKNGNRAAEQIYGKLSRREFLSLLKSPLTGVKSTVPMPSQGAGSRRAVTRYIPASTMTAARQRAKKAGATANDLLLAACYHAYAGLPGVDANGPMSIMSMFDLRHCEKVGESAGLANMSGSLPTKLSREVGDDFAATLAEVARQTAEIKNNPLSSMEGLPLLHGAARMLPLRLLLKAAPVVYGNMSLGMTNLGNVDCGKLMLGELRPDRGWFGGPLKKKPNAQISAASFDGECSLSIVGEYTAEDAVLLQSLVDAMAEKIMEYAGKMQA